MGGPGSGGARPGAGRPRSGTKAPRIRTTRKTTVSLDSEGLERDLESVASLGISYARAVLEGGEPADRLALTKIVLARLSRSMVETETDEFDVLRNEWRSMMGGLTGTKSKIVPLPERLETDDG